MCSVQLRVRISSNGIDNKGVPKTHLKMTFSSSSSTFVPLAGAKTNSSSSTFDTAGRRLRKRPKHGIGDSDDYIFQVFLYLLSVRIDNILVLTICVGYFVFCLYESWIYPIKRKLCSAPQDTRVFGHRAKTKVLNHLEFM